MTKGLKQRICVATLAAACAFFANCSGASAQEITPLEEGQPAPFAGDLFPTADSIRWGLEIEGCKEKSATQMYYATQRFDLEMAHQKLLANIGSEADQERIRLLVAELDFRGMWYRSPEFIAAVSVVATVAVMLSAGALIQATMGAK